MKEVIFEANESNYLSGHFKKLPATLMCYILTRLSIARLLTIHHTSYPVHWPLCKVLLYFSTILVFLIHLVPSHVGMILYLMLR